MAEPSSLNNQFTLDIWESMWKNNIAGWHEAEGNKMMWKHFPDLLARHFSVGPELLKVFVPLCGKATDMYMMYQMGFDAIVGVEFATQPIADFFVENSIKIQTNPIMSSSARDQNYTVSEDGRIMIGQGDLFNFIPENLPVPKYDIIWDRGSFEAVNNENRCRYADLTRSLLKDDGFILMHSTDYDKAEYGGPPLAANKEDLEKYYPDMIVKPLDRASMLDDQWRSWGLTWMDEICHVMTWKSAQ